MLFGLEDGSAHTLEEVGPVLPGHPRAHPQIGTRLSASSVNQAAAQAEGSSTASKNIGLSPGINSRERRGPLCLQHTPIRLSFRPNLSQRKRVQGEVEESSFLPSLSTFPISTVNHPRSAATAIAIEKLVAGCVQKRHSIISDALKNPLPATGDKRP